MQQKHPKPIQSISLYNMSMLIFMLITLFFLDLSLGVENENPSPRCPPAPKKPPPPKQTNIPQELIQTLSFEEDSKSVGNSSVDSTPPNLLRSSSVCPPAPRQQKNNKKEEAPTDISGTTRRLFKRSANTKGDDNVPTKHGH